jgi:magnesium-transporting ATPase (P-type)
LIDEIGLKVDQSMYFPKETRVDKEESQQRNGNPEFDNHKEHPDPFLFVDSKVMAGQGKAIVCAVGENTMLARHRK